MKESSKKVQSAGGGTFGAYFLAMIGALVYYLQASQGFWSTIWACVKAVLWPGFVTYDLLKFIG